MAALGPYPAEYGSPMQMLWTNYDSFASYYAVEDRSVGGLQSGVGRQYLCSSGRDMVAIIE
jgi:hypothetical protein